MKIVFSIAILVILSVPLGLADDSHAEDCLRLTNLVLRLESIDMVDDRYGYLKMMAINRGADTLSQELVEVASWMTARTNETDRILRERAIRSLSEFGTTNCLPFLYSIATNRSDSLRFAACGSFAGASAGEPRFTSQIEPILDATEPESFRFAESVYDTVFAILQCEDTPSESMFRYRTYLQGRTRSETRRARLLDQILLQVDQTWLTNVERNAFALRMLDDSTNALDVAYFQSITNSWIQLHE